MSWRIWRVTMSLDALGDQLLAKRWVLIATRSIIRAPAVSCGRSVMKGGPIFT